MGWLMVVVGRILFAALLAAPFLWVNGVLEISQLWTGLVWIGVLLTAVPPSLLQKVKLTPKMARLFPFMLLIVIGIVGGRTAVQFHTSLIIFFVVTQLILLALSFIYQQPSAAGNLALAMFSLLFTLFIANIGAGIVLAQLDQAQVTPPPPPTPEPVPTETPISNSQSPNTTPTNTPPPPKPTATLDPDITPSPTPIPESTRPIAGFGYLEWVEDNGEAEWTHLTAYGPRVNSVAHASMYDVEGNIVYDTLVEYNGKGYRGPEAAYEKPEDVYRILIVGDSFVEAIQVDYEQTFQALLQEQLNRHNTADRRYEVVAMGRTGWGTMHEATYYQVEGYKYNADLVILMFYINDVADNLPRVFYPGINNTNYDFVINEGRVQILDTNAQPLPPNNGRILYNALHWRLRETNLAKLYVRLSDPPIPVVTPGGVMTRVHPQFYIYVTEPEVEGYPEGWQRTGELLQRMADDVQADGGEFAVVPIFLGSEMVGNVSSWFPELVEGWQWDDGLPEKQLDAILDDDAVYLWPTRPQFEAYADDVDGQVYNLFYLPEDGHFNALGHQVTYEAIYNHLLENNIVDP